MSAAMEAEVRRFNLAVMDFAKREVPEESVKAHRWLSLEALRRIVLKSPVRTGRFRGNNQLSVGAPSTAEIPVAASIGRGADQILEEGRVATKALRPYGQTWICNNLPYSVPLEEGHSKQAPFGMYGQTVAELRDAIVPNFTRGGPFE